MIDLMMMIDCESFLYGCTVFGVEILTIFSIENLHLYWLSVNPMSYVNQNSYKYWDGNAVYIHKSCAAFI